MPAMARLPDELKIMNAREIRLRSFIKWR